METTNTIYFLCVLNRLLTSQLHHITHHEDLT